MGEEISVQCHHILNDQYDIWHIVDGVPTGENFPWVIKERETDEVILGGIGFPINIKLLPSEVLNNYPEVDLTVKSSVLFGMFEESGCAIFITGETESMRHNVMEARDNLYKNIFPKLLNGEITILKEEFGEYPGYECTVENQEADSE